MYIHFTLDARRDLRVLPRPVQERIVNKIRWYARQDDPLKMAKHLTNMREGQFRFRVGKYRAIFDVIQDTTYILRIVKRDEASY